MKDLLEYIIKSIVDKKEEVKITEGVDAEGGVLLTISVAEDDMGKVIGKEGKIIKAVRTIIRILAIKEGKRVTVNLEEKNPPREKTIIMDGQKDLPAQQE